MAVSSASRRAIGITIARVLTSTVVLFLLYAVWPLQGHPGTSAVAYLVIGLSAIFIIFGLQVRSILGSSRPALRAVEALATSIPLVLVAFASGYLVLSESDPSAFSEPLSRVSSIYFTITVFATVGFGDITPVQDVARIAVSIQMLTNLLVLGLGIKVVGGAVRLGRERQGTGTQTPQI